MQGSGDLGGARVVVEPVRRWVGLRWQVTSDALCRQRRARSGLQSTGRKGKYKRPQTNESRPLVKRSVARRSRGAGRGEQEGCGAGGGQA